MEVYRTIMLAIIKRMKPTIVKEEVTLKAIGALIDRSISVLATKDEMNESIDSLAGAVKKGFDEVHERFAKIDEKFAKVDEKFDHIDFRFGEIDKRFDKMDDQFKGIDLKFDGVTEQFEKMSKQMKQSDLKIDGVARRIQGVSNSMDAYTLVCVKHEEFSLLQRKIKILETV